MKELRMSELSPKVAAQKLVLHGYVQITVGN